MTQRCRVELPRTWTAKKETKEMQKLTKVTKICDRCGIVLHCTEQEWERHKVKHGKRTSKKRKKR